MKGRGKDAVARCVVEVEIHFEGAHLGPLWRGRPRVVAVAARPRGERQRAGGLGGRRLPASCCKRRAALTGKAPAAPAHAPPDKTMAPGSPTVPL